MKMTHADFISAINDFIAIDIIPAIEKTSTKFLIGALVGTGGINSRTLIPMLQAAKLADETTVDTEMIIHAVQGGFAASKTLNIDDFIRPFLAPLGLGNFSLGFSLTKEEGDKLIRRIS